MQIVGEQVSGSGNSWTLANMPVANSVALYAGGIRLTPGAGNDYTIVGLAIATVNNYPAGSLTADYQNAAAQNIIIGNDQLSPFALTTLQRVKDLLFDPNITFPLTGASLTENSTSVTGLTVPQGKTPRVGQIITGTGIPTGTVIAAIISSSQITLSQPATQSNSGQTLYVIDQTPLYDNMLIRMINWATNYINNECGRPSGFVQQTYVNDTYSIDNPRQSFLLLRNTPLFSLTSLEWRAGTPSNPSWTAFIPDQFEAVDPRTDPVSGITWYPSGMVRVYGVLPRLYSNMIRATYVAGYPVNWNNPEDHNTHWLPGDLTSVCENLAVRRFKRRMLAGQSSMTIEGATVSGWRNVLDKEDLDVLAQYRQLNF